MAAHRLCPGGIENGGPPAMRCPSCKEEIGDPAGSRCPLCNYDVRGEIRESGASAVSGEVLVMTAPAVEAEVLSMAPVEDALDPPASASPDKPDPDLQQLLSELG